MENTKHNNLGGGDIRFHRRRLVFSWIVIRDKGNRDYDAEEREKQAALIKTETSRSSQSR